MSGEGYMLTSGVATGLEEDLVFEAGGAAEYYGCDPGPQGLDAIARILLAARSWRERQAARERQHAAAADRSARELRSVLDLAEARRRTREREREELQLEAVYRYEQGRGHV